MTDYDAQQRIHQLESSVQDLKQCIRDLVSMLDGADVQDSDDLLVITHNHRLCDENAKERLSDILMKLG